MPSTLLVGATGLVGSHILSTLLESTAVTKVSTLARRPPPVQETAGKLQVIEQSDSAKWASELGTITPPPDVFFSALGTTRAKAGGLAGQRKVDYDLNLELAKAAQAAGVKTYVLISSAGTSATSPIPYSKMKAELEAAVSALEFEHVVIVKPGLLMGKREAPDLLQSALNTLARGVGLISGGRLVDFWAQDADIIGKATVTAALQAASGQGPAGRVWFVQQADIVRLGRTEWKST
ncbi:MAG: hypothetical protein M1838_000669 [Thelocarpon superellum]|nr:MAG: hypothetical protein M1838_000669 [Thelocarpon superellum]